MKTLAFTAAILLASSALADGPPVQTRPTPTSPVVQLGDSDHGFCTAFLVTPNFFATAGHCVDAADYMDLKIVANTAKEGNVDPAKDLIPVRLVAFSDASAGLDDWALLTFQNPTDVIEDWKPAKLDCTNNPVLGDDVTYEGYPHAQSGHLTVERGYIDTTPQSDNGGPPLYAATFPVSGGASGSPAEYDEGKVFGIVVAENEVQNAWAYIQPIDPVCQALRSYLQSP